MNTDATENQTLHQEASAHQKSYARQRLALIVGTIFLLSCLIGFTVWDIYRDYHSTIRNVEKQTSSYAKALKEHAERTFSELERVLDTAVPQLETACPLNSIGQSQLTALLNRKFGRMPQLASLAVVDATGHLRATTATNEPVTGIDVSERPFFHFHQSNNSTQLFINPPFKSRINGKWRFSLSRRLNNPNGSMAGILFAVIDLAYFEELYKGLATDQNSRFTLASLNGDYLVLAPGAEEVYTSGKKTAPFFRKMVEDRPTRTYHNRHSNVAGEHRIVSYHRLDLFPVVAIVSFGHDQALAGWRSAAQANIITISVLSVCIVLLVSMVVRQLSLLERRVQERTVQLQLSNSFLENEIQERLKGEQQLREQQQQMEQLA